MWKFELYLIPKTTISSPLCRKLRRGCKSFTHRISNSINRGRQLKRRCSHLAAEIVLFKSTVRSPSAQIVFFFKDSCKVYEYRSGKQLIKVTSVICKPGVVSLVVYYGAWMFLMIHIICWIHHNHWKIIASCYATEIHVLWHKVKIIRWIKVL